MRSGVEGWKPHYQGFLVEVGLKPFFTREGVRSIKCKIVFHGKKLFFLYGHL